MSDSSENVHPLDDARFKAGVALLGRTGSVEFQIRYEDETEPVVWIAVAKWRLGPDNKPRPQDDPEGVGDYYKCAAAFDPIQAVLNLCEVAIDGGECQHCKRPSAFEKSNEDLPDFAVNIFCVYSFNQERNEFVRSCELSPSNN